MINVIQDQRPATWEHIHTVQMLLLEVIQDLQQRMITHDQSKLHEPERAIFDEATHRLKGLVYGSEEYTAQLKDMKPALDHHYANNRHHPEFFSDGVNGMTLVDLLEMIVDWKAATMRHATGSITNSLEVNKKRFNLSPEIIRILENTVAAYGWQARSPMAPKSQT